MGRLLRRSLRRWRYRPADRHPVGRLKVILRVARSVEPVQVRAVSALQRHGGDVSGVGVLDGLERWLMPRWALGVLGLEVAPRPRDHVGQRLAHASFPNSAE